MFFLYISGGAKQNILNVLGTRYRVHYFKSEEVLLRKSKARLPNTLVSKDKFEAATMAGYIPCFFGAVIGVEKWSFRQNSPSLIPSLK